MGDDTVVTVAFWADAAVHLLMRESPSSFMLGDDHNVLRPLSQQEDDFSL